MAKTNPLRTGSGKIDPPGEQACAQAMRLNDDTRIVRLANLKEGKKRHPGKKGSQAKKNSLNLY
jgi:hypothetical protein